MQRTFTRHIANILIACFSLVFVHMLMPHSHRDSGTSLEKHQHHHHESTSHSHSGLPDLLDFLMDISHIEIGENHLEEYLTSSKQVSPTNQIDFSDDGLPGTNLQLVYFHSKDFDGRKLLKTPRPLVFIDNSLTRGPPFLS